MHPPEPFAFKRLRAGNRRAFDLYLLSDEEPMANMNRPPALTDLLSQVTLPQNPLVSLPADPDELSIGEMVSAHAAINPQASAVITDGAILTYAELDRRANQ